tara:strand:- start:470 stop:673 length:204 start_codon:yes stop_codon:yes gene_type:complete
MLINKKINKVIEMIIADFEGNSKNRIIEITDKIKISTIMLARATIEPVTIGTLPVILLINSDDDMFR